MSAQCQQDTLIKRILQQAKHDPSHDALVTPTLIISYSQLAKLIQIQVKKYTDLGITNQSVIGIQCADDTRHLLMYLAATHIGATVFTIPAYESEDSKKALSDSCHASHILDRNNAIDLHTDTVSAEPELEISSLQGTFLFSTSGTTGKPKLVIHQDSDLVDQSHRHIESKDERFACLASMDHNFARRHRLYCIAVGATNVFPDATQESLIAQCQSLSVNVLHVSAFQARELLAMPDIDQLTNIRLKLGGSHVPHTLRRQLKNNITKNLQAGYGTTETGAISFTDPNDQHAGESVGQPLAGIEVSIVSSERTPLNNGIPGEIAIRCAGMFRGYHEQPCLTKSRLDNGWFYTGDMGYLDKQHRIHLCGRADDMFLFNSMNIYPQDIESQICQFPAVVDAAVLPLKSSAHENIPVALVVFAEKAKPDLHKLKKYMRKRVGVRCPRQFTVVNKIPRNSNGKILRNDVIKLSTHNTQVRRSIVHALRETGSLDHLDQSLIIALEAGDKDMSLKEIGIDSLTRMELMVAIELKYDTIIMPSEFSRLRTINDIVTRVMQPPSQIDDAPLDSNSPRDNFPELVNDDVPPYIVRFFQRVFSYCHTAGHLNKALTTLEARLTPTEVKCLHNFFLNKKLIPTETDQKFYTILTIWFQGLERMFSISTKTRLESFVAKRVKCTATHFVGPGKKAEKTLLICFSARGSRCLMIPNAVLLQHTDATQYDLLIISEPFNANYQQGVPLLGNNLIDVVQTLKQLELTHLYRSIRTLGFSAGGYAAMIAGHLLHAEMAVSVAGRFPSKHKHPIIFFNMILTSWRVMRARPCQHMLMSYGANKSRDRKFADIMARLFGCTRDVVNFNDEDVGHNILGRLVERGELHTYLARTLFK